jgi:hypothetical protein
LRMGDLPAATAAYRAFVAANPTGAASEQARRVLAELAPGDKP